MNKILKKIAKKFLFILPIFRVQLDWIIRKVIEFYEICEIYETVQAKKRQEVYPMNFKRYLSGTEERIERLRKVINKRPVAIILPGFSVRELKERITELKDCDICYASMNAFWVLEKHILEKINRNLSVIMCSADPSKEINNIVDFLEKKEDNIFISERESFQRTKKKLPKGFDLDKFIEKYNEKLLFFTAIFTPFILTVRGGLFPHIPSRKYPLHFPAQNSLSVLLSLALIGEASKVLIFGGDGGRINTRKLYFEEELYFEKSYSWKQGFTSEDQLVIDARIFNATMPLMLKRIYKIYNLRPVDIINCSEGSHYTPFRKLSYNETFAILKKGRLAP